MHTINPIDPGRTIDWGKTSQDYATHRPGPPPRFYQTLQTWGVGVAGQTILDLGTGTGVLARQFARQGAVVHGIDIAANQIATAQQLAAQEGLAVDFQCVPAEELSFADATFDVITANQCWLYFDKAKVIPVVKRLLRPGGMLVTSHFSWLPRLDPVAHATEQLVLQHNPAWSAHDWSGEIPTHPAWAEGHFAVKGMFWFDEPVPFTYESWRGRIRACRGVGAALDAVDVAKFDAAHEAMLAGMVPAEFTVLHRVDAHLCGM
jgi:2-polyprenyl-3-methyl-5-hydroxy-6-metoxy-1,4-benzoquinol methylase